LGLNVGFVWSYRGYSKNVCVCVYVCVCVCVCVCICVFVYILFHVFVNRTWVYEVLRGSPRFFTAARSVKGAGLNTPSRWRSSAGLDPAGWAASSSARRTSEKPRTRARRWARPGWSRDLHRAADTQEDNVVILQSNLVIVQSNLVILQLNVVILE